VDTSTAHGDERVHRPRGLADRQARQDRETAARGHRAGHGGHGLDDDALCEARGLGEHLVRSGQIEDLEVREDGEDDASAGHTSTLAATPDGGKDTNMTIPAT
jgi:hypothetical protein